MYEETDKDLLSKQHQDDVSPTHGGLLKVLSIPEMTISFGDYSQSGCRVTSSTCYSQDDWDIWKAVKIMPVCEYCEAHYHSRGRSKLVELSEAEQLAFLSWSVPLNPSGNLNLSAERAALDLAQL